MGWKNAENDKLLEDLDLEFDANKRLDIIHKITKNYTDEVPVLPLYYRSDISVVPKSLKNYRPSGHQFAETNKVEEWDLGGTTLN